MPVGDSACIELNQAKPNAVRVASAPPPTTASASPYWIIRSAEPIAWAPEAQAETTPKLWPRSPCFIVTAAAPALGMYCGMPSGETIFAPRSRITSCCVSTVSMPPMPVAITQPMRSGS